MEKKAIRKIIRELKKEIIPSLRQGDAISTLEETVFSRVELLHEFMCSRNILMYHSLGDEFPTHDTIACWAALKNIFLPRVCGDDLEILPFAPGDGGIRDGAYGIKEPQGENPVPPAEIDLIIVPAMAFDPCGNRLGRGKGFYDRLLRQTHATCIGVAFDFQLLDALPTDSHDIKMDYIFTPNYSIHIT